MKLVLYLIWTNSINVFVNLKLNVILSCRNTYVKYFIFRSCTSVRDIYLIFNLIGISAHRSSNISNWRLVISWYILLFAAIMCSLALCKCSTSAFVEYAGLDTFGNINWTYSIKIRGMHHMNTHRSSQKYFIRFHSIANAFIKH